MVKRFEMPDGLTGFAALAVVLALGTAAAHAQPVPIQFRVEDGGTGHFYQLFTACDFPGNTGISWAAANTAAGGKIHLATPGHLVTITSKAENDFVNALRASILPAACGRGSKRTQAWIGGFQANNQASPGAGWQWVNGEGVIPGANAVGNPDPDPYRNWAAGQPDDGDGAENNAENHLAQGQFDGTGTWTDEDTTPRFVGGYIVEYDVVAVSLDECVLVTGDCNPFDNQVIKLPASARFQRNAGKTINLRIFEFADARVNPSTGACANGSQQDLRPFGDNSLVIPWWLCGSPNYLVVKTDASDVEIPEDTVFIANEKLDENLFECQAPEVGDRLQHRDVVVWQSTDRLDMLEQSAGEFTNGCGSSLGRSRGASFFVMGMHIDFGITNDPVQVFQAFVELTRQKLVLLQQATDAASAVLGNGDYSKLRGQVGNTIRQLDRRDYNGALSEIGNFIKFAEAATYAASPSGFNHEGELLMRSLNVQFMLSDKIVPNQP